MWQAGSWSHRGLRRSAALRPWASLRLSLCVLFGFFQMVEGATHGMRLSGCQPVLPLILCMHAHWTVINSVFYSVMHMTPDPHLRAFMLLINSCIIIVWQDKWTESWLCMLYVMSRQDETHCISFTAYQSYDEILVCNWPLFTVPCKYIYSALTVA